ncbi:hypothetical protein, partial [Enterocloster lavalensis]|uniref:hypothetical protein n=1 Tax=Enterocloster lavalensis TaxID=460384 RepID=UPI002FD883E9
MVREYSLVSQGCSRASRYVPASREPMAREYSPASLGVSPVSQGCSRASLEASRYVPVSPEPMVREYS